MFPNLVTYHIHTTDPLPPNQALAYEYILAQGGVYLRAQTRFWEACIPVVPCLVRGLLPLKPFFRLKIPRLSEKLLTDTLAHARQARQPDGRLKEVLYHFHHTGSEIRVMRPRQQGTAVSILSPGGDDPTILLDLHSHGNLAAFFSQTDNADEQGCRLYGVLGKVDTAPEMQLRVGIYGYWKPLPVPLLFDGHEGIHDLEETHERHEPAGR